MSTLLLAPLLTEHVLWAPPSGSGGSVDRSSVLRDFEPPPEPWAAGHRGVDWALQDGRVLAPAAGTVRFVGDVAGRPVITVAHTNGMLSSLEPVVAAEGLAVGDRVDTGDQLGTVDADVHHCETRCVHWGVRIPDGWIVEGTAWDRYVDPLMLLGWTGPSVLWPLEGDPPAT
ncbi:M23 family metallopeptidase [Citricoccus sp. GCM10030269]|uniref:M23 family metallopeptidase n=1 Tax=Citricoccus sp. GCM10030269 TaxID=3273388 RepID=UPI0036135D93